MQLSYESAASNLVLTRCLLRQIDDRPIYPVLDDNTTHASLSFAINYHYALRHGYDYRVAVVENDEAHKANVTISNSAGYPTLPELLLHAKGNVKGCFHPIIGVQRSSPWQGHEGVP